MSPKIKMKDIHDERDDDIIELSVKSVRSTRQRENVANV